MRTDATPVPGPALTATSAESLSLARSRRLLRVDEALKLRHRLELAALGEIDRGLDFSARLALEPLVVVLVHETEGLEPCRQPNQWPFLLPGLDLGLVPIELSVEHRVPAEAVGPELEEHRPRPRAHTRRCSARRVLDGEYVHAIDDLGRQAVDARFAGDIGLRFSPLDCGAHRIQVVFAQK